jgi:hypothetical protein
MYIYVCSMYVVYTYEFMYVCIHVSMHVCAYVHIYICTVVYMVGLVLFFSIILLVNRSSRNIFLLRGRLNLYMSPHFVLHHNEGRAMFLTLRSCSV